jgi:pimeloyl-ACP methyl ester carboxylesterase
MLTVVRNHPEAVRSLILNSPLPGYVNYEEHALYNINEALDQVFANCEADSVGNKAYDNLKSRFHQYFTAITGKKFSISYLEKGARDSVKIGYTKNELLDAIVNRLNTDQVKTVPAVINDIVNGKYDRYIREGIDGSFSGDKDIALGMRYSVYCSEQIAYSNLAIQQQQDKLMPWFSGYSCNSPNQVTCDCWKVNPEPPVVKTPVYSNVPALIVAGDIDPWCRPFYNRLIKRTMPNSQLLIRHNKGHAPGFSVDGVDYVKLFLANPLRKLISQSKDLVIE